ncbi:hypothetical protein GW17_00019041 [Ensete ventricosum]|nr:hypothetical protein GW17_00019041 [Ensete ventricosum]RZR93423.1 hypothetical protein BHM03_00021936 [Ensete ventricosum]
MVYLWVRRSLQQGPEACPHRYAVVHESCSASFLVVLVERTRFERVPDHGGGSGSDHGDDRCPLKKKKKKTFLIRFHCAAALRCVFAFSMVLYFCLSCGGD